MKWQHVLASGRRAMLGPPELPRGRFLVAGMPPGPSIVGPCIALGRVELGRVELELGMLLFSECVELARIAAELERASRALLHEAQGMR